MKVFKPKPGTPGGGSGMDWKRYKSEGLQLGMLGRVQLSIPNCYLVMMTSDLVDYRLGCNLGTSGCN